MNAREMYRAQSHVHRYTARWNRNVAHNYPEQWREPPPCPGRGTEDAERAARVERSVARSLLLIALKCRVRPAPCVQWGGRVGAVLDALRARSEAPGDVSQVERLRRRYRDALARVGMAPGTGTLRLRLTDLRVASRLEQQRMEAMAAECVAMTQALVHQLHGRAA